MPLSAPPEPSRRHRHCSGCVSGGTPSRTLSAWTPTPVRCGGRKSAKRRSLTVSPAPCTPTGTGRNPAPGSATADGWDSRASSVKKKSRDRDRVTFTTGAIRVEPDRRHITLPRIGTVRTAENTRRLERLLAKGRARILAVTVSRKGTRIVVAFRVLLSRPQQPRIDRRSSTVGVDVGVRVLATVGTPDGTILERIPNPRALDAALKQLRHLRRERSRRTIGSRGYRETQDNLTRLHRRVGDIRAHHIHNLTTRFAKTHGTIVVEGLDAAGMLRQKGLTGARARRRGLADAVLAEPSRQLGYKTGWYGSRLVVADRCYPSSKACHKCQHRQDIGWAEHWTCDRCSARHQRDDNASINLARYEESAAQAGSAVGPVGAAVKRGADRKTGPRPAGGCEARKGGRRKPAEQPRDGVPA